MPYIYVPPADYEEQNRLRSVAKPFEPPPDYPITIRLSKEAVQALRMDEFSRRPSPQIIEEEEEDEYEDEIPHISIAKRIEALQDEPPKLMNDRTRNRIRNIGVPVLPPIAVTDSDGKGVSLEENRAFLRHLANHRNFDTMKSLRTCDDCPICRIVVQNHFDTIEDGSSESSSPLSSHNHQNHSTPPRGKARPDVRDLFAPL